MPSPASAAASDSASPARAAAAPVTVREVAKKDATGDFARLSWTINARDPQWVPPLRMALDPLLNGKHPFHQHADVAFFAAYRGAEMVGRIAAVVNHRHNEFHGDKVGFFGLYESIDDQAVASALLDTASAWLKARGMDTIRGPFNLSTNDELYSAGFVIDGFDRPTTFMMGHNPPWYAPLMDGAGMVKAKDLVAYWVASNRPPQRLLDGIERLGKREGWRIRSLNMKRFKQEVATVMSVYNSAWERNWGFVPMTEAEFDHMAKEFKPVVDPDLVLIAENDAGEAIGFMLSLPDLNQAARHLPNGRLLPFGWIKFLWHQRRVHGMRMLTLGLKPGHQTAGIGAAMYLRCFQVGAEKGYTTGEGSWILEDNWKMRQAMEKVGAHVHKTWRIYERPL